MMTTKATSHQKTCHPLKEAHANAVCKEYCGSVGYLLGECGKEGICVCEKRQLDEWHEYVVDEKKIFLNKGEHMLTIF